MGDIINGVLVADEVEVLGWLAHQNKPSEEEQAAASEAKRKASFKERFKKYLEQRAEKKANGQS